MLGVQKRKEIKALLHEQKPPVVARLAGVSLSSVKRIAKEPEIFSLDDAAERRRRRIGRPSKIEGFRRSIAEILEQNPETRSVEILHSARVLGFTGGKTTLYTLVASIRAEMHRLRSETRLAAPARISHYGLR